MKNKLNSSLLHNLRVSNFKKVKEILEKHEQEIDVSYNNNMLVYLAVANNTPDILSKLLDIYKRTKLQDEPDSMGYKIFNYQLHQVLEEAREENQPISNEIQDILCEYISSTEDDSLEQSLDDFPKQQEDEAEFSDDQNDNIDYYLNDQTEYYQGIDNNTSILGNAIY